MPNFSFFLINNLIEVATPIIVMIQRSNFIPEENQKRNSRILIEDIKNWPHATTHFCHIPRLPCYGRFLQ